ncbi:MAG: aldehyde dehydrogenase family protein [Polyangiaceae bacterium]|nr:aldehyde dehydrogenase family protein [Polyangiaceae bacterium]MCW5790282.1 aldehyde dehydrogenase family protein [Polyangiaceae bacterium]
MKISPQDNGHPATLHVQNVIAGEERAVSQTYASRSPAHREDVVALAPRSTKEEVREACAKSRAAQRAWARTPAPARAQVIGRLGQLLREEKESLSRFVSREMGKPIREARGSVQEAIDTCDFFQSEGRRLYGQTVPSELSNKELYTYRRPVGVVGVITAGNFPIAVPSWKLVPALLCGNSAVWKPSDDAPGIGALFADLWYRAGLPREVLSVVHGGGAEGAGQFLIEMMDEGLLDKISFTGSTEVGRLVGEVCGRNLKRPSLELGGKNPLVILADADLDLAVDGALWSSFGTAGQRCTSCGNIIVDKRVLPQVRELLVKKASALKIGDPMNEGVDYGPFINERFLERWVAQRSIGIEDGASLLLDGRRVTPGNEPEGFSGDAQHGLYATPRIFEHVKMNMRIAQEECFGPTVNLVEVDGLDEAIEAANGTPYGLSSAIYTRDAKAMLRFKEEIQAGMTSVNNSTTGAEAHLPFGGNGASGNGSRESGIWVIESYTRWQAVNVDLAGKLQLAQIDLEDAAPPEKPDWSQLVR